MKLDSDNYSVAIKLIDVIYALDLLGNKLMFTRDVNIYSERISTLTESK